MIALLTLLADVVPADVAPAADDQISVKVLYGILTVVITAVVGAVMRGVGIKHGEKVARQQGSVQIEGQPITVKLDERYMTREDFRDYKAEVANSFTRMEGLIIRQSDNVETKHLELLATIERAAETGVNGRVALWNELREEGKKIAKLEAHVDIGERIERIAREHAPKLLMTPTAQPTKRNSTNSHGQ